MKTCGLIGQRKVNGMTSICIVRDKLIISISQYELSNVKIIMSKTRTVINDKLIRKNLTSYLKVIDQYNHYILPLITKMRQLSHHFLNSVSTEI